MWLTSLYKLFQAMTITAPPKNRMMVFGYEATGNPIASIKLAVRNRPLKVPNAPDPPRCC